MRKMGKRVLAFVCMIALLLSSTNMLSIVQANTNPESFPEELTKIGWADLGITDDTEIQYNEAGWGTTDKNVDGKSVVNSSFRGMLKFQKTAGQNMWFQYGSNLDNLNGKGIRFTLTDEGTLKVYDMVNGGSELAVITADAVGLASGTFLNTDFELGFDIWQPTTESNDLKLDVFINGKKYNTDSYTINSGASKMVNCVDLMVQGTSDSLKLYAEKVAPKDLTPISWSDLGITENTAIQYNEAGWGTTDKYVVDKTVLNASFRGTLKFQKTAGQNMWFQYGANIWDLGTKGIRFSVKDDGEMELFDMVNGGIKLDVIKASDAGLTSGTFLNTDFELGIDLWQPSTGSDILKLDVYINGSKYNANSYIISGGKLMLLNCANMMVQGLGDSIAITVEEATPELTPISWSDLGITENTTIQYNEAGWGTTDKNIAEKSVVNSSFRGMLKFQKTAGQNMWFQYGSNLDHLVGKGIRFTLTDEGTLKVYDMVNGGSELAEITANAAGLTSGTFLNADFELGIDLWQPSASSEDMKLDVYINGNKYNDNSYTIGGGASKMENCIDLMVGGTSDYISLIVEEETQPVELTSIDWKSFGITTDKTCRATDDAKIISENPVSTLSGTSFRGNVTFHRASAEDTLMLSVGCSGNGWDGLRITQSDDALSVSGIWLNAAGVDFTTTITKEMAQVDSFSNQELELGLDIWTTNQTDYKIDVFVNGHKATESPIVWANAVTNGYLQNNLAYYATGTSMLEMLLHEAPDVVPDNLKSVTWEDLKIDEDDYGYTTGGFSKIGTSEKASLKGVSFRGEMKFIGSGAEMTFGDNSGGWQLGLNFIPQEDGTLRVWNRSDNSDDKIDVILNPAQVGLTSFVDTKFELGVDAWADGKNLKYILYINGIRYNEKAYIWKGGAASELCYDYLTIGLLVRDRSSQIAVLYPEVEKEASPEGLKKITWADFAIGNKKYTLADTADQTGLLVKSNNALSSLLDTSFSGKIKFSKLTTDGNLMVCYGANGWNWDGIRISMTEDGKLRFQGMDLAHELYPVIVDVTTKKAGVESFNGQTLTLGIDIWKSGNDAKINIFVNGVQCTTRAYVWKDAIKNKCVGNGMNLVVDKEKDSLTVESIVESFGNSVKPATSLKEISFSSFGIADGVYASKHPDFAVQGGFFDPAIGKSLNGTLLNVDLRFAGENVEFRYGGMDNAWEGLVLRSSGKHLLLVDTSGLLAEFVPEFAGTELTNKKINLKISLNYVDSDQDGAKDDVKLGFWFNNVLYRNQFIYLKDYSGKLGSRLGVYIPEGSGTLAVTSAAVDNSIDFALFGFTKNFKQYLLSTGIAKEIRTKL